MDHAKSAVRADALEACQVPGQDAEDHETMCAIGNERGDLVAVDGISGFRAGGWEQGWLERDSEFVCVAFCCSCVGAEVWWGHVC